LTDKHSYAAFCAGAGIGCEGLKNAGFDCKLFVEWDDERQDVLRFNHPGVQIEGDLTKLRSDQVPSVDLWFASLPCEPYSKAGKRKGLQDERGWPLLAAFIRLLWECVLLQKGPKFVLWENVDSWLDGEHEAAKCLCGAIKSLGFCPVWGEVLNARDFGVAQDRSRTFLVFAREGLTKTFRVADRVRGRPRWSFNPIRRLPLDYLGRELSREEIAAIEPRLRKRSGSAALSENMLRKIAEFTGLAEPRETWRGLAVFHSTRNPRCCQPGFSPTLTKDCRLVVRLPESGRIFKVQPTGYEMLMGVKRDLTRYGEDKDGRLYEMDAGNRQDMLGDGICAPIVEWIGREIGALIEI
jgi:DNA-cytosine methyltransferase